MHLLTALLGKVLAAAVPVLVAAHLVVPFKQFPQTEYYAHISACVSQFEKGNLNIVRQLTLAGDSAFIILLKGEVLRQHGYKEKLDILVIISRKLNQPNDVEAYFVYDRARQVKWPSGAPDPMEELYKEFESRQQPLLDEFLRSLASSISRCLQGTAQRPWEYQRATLPERLRVEPL